MNEFDWQEKYHALLRRARHPNTPGPEAAACLEKAAELAVKYRLSEHGSERPNTSREDVHVAVLTVEHGGLRHWHVSISQAACELFGCQSYGLYDHRDGDTSNWRDAVWHSGKPDVVHSSAEFFATCIQAMENLVESRLPPDPDSYRLGFSIGVTESILRILAKNCEALALIEKAEVMTVDAIMKVHPDVDQTMPPPKRPSPDEINTPEQMVSIVRGARDGEQFADRVKGVERG